MSKPAIPTTSERDLLVFAIWAVLGFAGLCFLLEGFSRDAYLVSLAGIAAIVAGFAAHIVINAIFATGFRPGEAALGIGTFGVIALAAGVDETISVHERLQAIGRRAAGSG